MNPCEGCAYTEGAEANREPQSHLKAQLALLGGLPFYCHHAKDGSLQDHPAMTSSERRGRVQAGLLVICRGWRREVGALAAEGYYGKARGIKKALAILAVGALQIFLTTKNKRKKERAAKNLKKAILALNREGGFTETVNDEESNSRRSAGS